MLEPAAELLQQLCDQNDICSYSAAFRAASFSSGNFCACLVLHVSFKSFLASQGLQILVSASASQCLETLIEGTIHTASTKIALVRNAIPFVQALRESALKCKKKSDLPFELEQELEVYVGSFAQQLLTVIATHLPNSESVVRSNLRWISIREWLAKIWQLDEEKPQPAYNATSPL